MDFAAASKSESKQIEVTARKGRAEKSLDRGGFLFIHRDEEGSLTGSHRGKKKRGFFLGWSRSCEPRVLPRGDQMKFSNGEGTAMAVGLEGGG